MPFPMSTPAEITRRMEASMEASLRKVFTDVDPAAINRAVRSEKGLAAALIRATTMAIYETHLHLRWWGDQYFPDTAELDALIRHASIWGITRRAATRAIGKATVAGAAGTVIPKGIVLAGSGTVTFVVTAAVTLGSSGAGTINLQAVDAGADGNTVAGTLLTFVDDVDGLTVQTATVDDEGLTGGAAIETPASLLERLLAEIQEPAHGGASFDYPRWVQNSFAASYVSCLPSWVGPGTVGVVVAMGTKALPRVPTSSELTAIAAEIEVQRPVTAEVHVLPVELAPRTFAISIAPYEQAVRSAVTTAIKTFLVREAAIGGRLYHSRLSEAISAAAGEYRHELTSPAGDIASTDLKLSTFGSISWSALS